MSGKLVAEDVPVILARRQEGETVRALASSYNVSEPLIYNVLRGWVPLSRAEVEDLAERKRIAAEKGLKAPLRKPYEMEPRRARSALTKAIAKGTLVRTPCWCGEIEVQGHHHNGYGPGHELEVTWLCDAHHKAAHAAMRKTQQSVDETPKVDRVDTSTTTVELTDIEGTHEGFVSRTTGEIKFTKAPFLRALVDDCLTCGHEWHSNEDGGCKAAKGPRDRCGCKAYLDAGTPF